MAIKNILLNKKWLRTIALLFLVISLSSCSGISYWASDKAPYPNLLEIITTEDFTFFSFLSTVAWIFSIVGLLFFFLGKRDDVVGGHHWINIDGKTHHVINYDEITSIKGTGSTERGHSWSNNVLAFILYVVVAHFIYATLKNWFGGINGLIAVILAVVYIIGVFSIHSKVKPIIGTIKHLAWIYTAIDCTIGTIILLWNYTF